MGESKEEKTIIFYGKNWTPLSEECYGCYHYGFICEGSVFASECRGHIVEDIIPSVLANLILNQTKNQFTLARIWGYDLKNDISIEEIEKIKNSDLSEKYQEALNEPEEVIQKYIEMYGIDRYGTKKVFNETDVSPEPIYEDTFANSKVIQVNDEDPFDNQKINIKEITEDNLPF